MSTQAASAPSPGTLNPVAQAVFDLALRVDEEFSGVEAKTLAVIDYELEQKDLVSSYISSVNESADFSSDLNIVLKSPFVAPETYAAALGSDLVAGLKAQEEEFFETFGAYPTFSPKVIETRNTDAKFFGMCDELAEQVEAAYEHVTLLLIPETGFKKAFTRWLERIEAVWTSPRVQILVTDCKDDPALGTLPDSYGERTQRIEVEADMDEIIMATFDQSVGEIGPEADYQKAVMTALMGIKKQDYGKARRFSKQAFDIATENSWTTMQVMALIYYGASVPHVEQQESVKAADQALGLMKGLDPEADPSVPKLKYQVLMMKGQAYLTHKEYAKAAPSYEDAYALCEAMENPLLMLETARMASFCHYHGGDHVKAWDWGDRGLKAAMEMPADAVPMTTFPFLVDHLDEVRLRGRDSEARSSRLDRFMTQMMGENWRPQIKEMVP